MEITMQMKRKNVMKQLKKADCSLMQGKDSSVETAFDSLAQSMLVHKQWKKSQTQSKVCEKWILIFTISEPAALKDFLETNSKQFTQNT